MATITPEMIRLDAAIEKEFAAEIAAGAISNLGVYNCRRKNSNPNNGWSEHSWGNAKDYRIKPDDGPAGDRLAAWARRHPELVSETFWKVRFHHGHVHLTAAPRRNPDNKQTPPCAGGIDKDKKDMELIKAIQRNMNAAGFTDFEGKPLKVDGVIGKRTESAMLKRDRAQFAGGGINLGDTVKIVAP